MKDFACDTDRQMKPGQLEYVDRNKISKMSRLYICRNPHLSDARG